MGVIPRDPGFPWEDLITIGLLSFQAGAKLLTSRVLDYAGLPVVILTTMYADLVSDPGLFSVDLFGNPQRNRRAGAALFYFVGAVVGGVAASQSIGFSGGLMIATGIQIVLVIAWLVWKEEVIEEDDSETSSI